MGNRDTVRIEGMDYMYSRYRWVRGAMVRKRVGRIAYVDRDISVQTSSIQAS